MDINTQWVTFASFTNAGGFGGTTLVPGMTYGWDHFLYPQTRDFVAVFQR